MQCEGDIRDAFQAYWTIVHRNKIAAAHTQKDKDCLKICEEKFISFANDRDSGVKMDAIMTQKRQHCGDMRLHSSKLCLASSHRNI